MQQPSWGWQRLPAFGPTTRSAAEIAERPAAEEWARYRGFSKVTLVVFSDNRRAKAVYEPLGWQPELETWYKLLP